MAPIIRVVVQRHPADCGVATLAMLLGVSYEDALVALAAEEPAVLTRGCFTKHLEAAAVRLGFRLSRVVGTFAIGSPRLGQRRT